MSDTQPLAPVYRNNVHAFAGRVGANQSFTAGPVYSDDESFVDVEPDAAPHMPLRELLDLRPLLHPNLWKAALIEGVGTCMFMFITMWAGVAPARLPTPPTAQLGSFNNASFFGPLVGGITNVIFLTLFITAFGAVSGAHFNPLITFATFTARLCSLPRLILYISFQLGGSTIAGLLLRASYGTRNFQVGGCWMYTDFIPEKDAFVVELVASCILLFLAFGVALDPRQSQIVGPALAPLLVGLALGTLTFSTSFTRYGYGGASMNPGRCFGVFVGSGFPTYHWVHWVPDLVACVFHGIIYYFIPPWTKYEPTAGLPPTRASHRLGRASNESRGNSKTPTRTDAV